MLGLILSQAVISNVDVFDWNVLNNQKLKEKKLIVERIISKNQVRKVRFLYKIVNL